MRQIRERGAGAWWIFARPGGPWSTVRFCTNGVTNLDLIGAMLDVPREAFVPERQAALAYLDRDLPMPSGSGAPRYLIKPEVTAKLIQAADVMPQDRVLVVGAATGYSAAIVSRLAAAVVALEEDPASPRWPKPICGISVSPT